MRPLIPALLSPELGASIGCVKGVHRLGMRVGTAEQGKRLLKGTGVARDRGWDQRKAPLSRKRKKGSGVRLLPLAA